MTENVPMIDIGSAMLGITVAEKLRRNRKITSTTSASVSTSVNLTSFTEASMVAVAGFYIPLFAPLFTWPSWVLDLSLFHLYGTPLTTGVYWTGLWVMVAIVVVGFGGAMAAMRGREVGR